MTSFHDSTNHTMAPSLARVLPDKRCGDQCALLPSLLGSTSNIFVFPPLVFQPQRLSPFRSWEGSSPLWIIGMACQLLSAVERHECLPPSYVRPEQQRPRLGDVVGDLHVPLIDLRRREKSRKIIKQIADACGSYGIFQVFTLHLLLIPRLSNSLDRSRSSDGL